MRIPGKPAKPSVGTAAGEKGVKSTLRTYVIASLKSSAECKRQTRFENPG